MSAPERLHVRLGGRALLDAVSHRRAPLHRNAGQGDVAFATHRTSAGNRPSGVENLDELTPRPLGPRLALNEHGVFCQGTIWQTIPFDQWSVELIKRQTNFGSTNSGKT